ncbi:hypothetical protein D9758_006879 [Tetrapyrgos nigripes]|uniref:glutaminase n=1 Tax=Tetrapyrgos nigripes TaxID=182062 RepID=A0A8H5GS74_9AGAR|nr:hypothetical protein D9758_006879 [Tetrapyrgos nigripes]
MLNGTGYPSSGLNDTIQVTIGILGGYLHCGHSFSRTDASFALLPFLSQSRRYRLPCPDAALQGAFVEHQTALERLDLRQGMDGTSEARRRIDRKVRVVLVKTKEDLDVCHALIIPGGESTTISLVAQRSGLFQPLKDFIHAQRKPVWGTCAGAILLSRTVVGAKKGGQELLGGMGVVIERNGWGSQVESFEAPLQVPGLRDPQTPFTGIFIRAPVILSLDQSSFSSPSPPQTLPPSIEIIACLPSDVIPHAKPLFLPSLSTSSSSSSTSELHTHTLANPNLYPDHHPDPHKNTQGTDTQGIGIETTQGIVALRQSNLFLTTFHPELTDDTRFHEFFVRECVMPCILQISKKNETIE